MSCYGNTFDMSENRAMFGNEDRNTMMMTSFAPNNESSGMMLTMSSSEERPKYLDPYAAFYQVSQGRAVITCKELQKAIQLTGLDIPIEVCNQFVKKFDVDKNSGIDTREYECIVTEIGEWVKVFEYFDVDKSGGLNFAEFSKSLEQMGHILPAELVNLLFKNFDTNRSGLLDFGNFLRVSSIIQIAKAKMQQYGAYGASTITIDLNQLLDIVFSIAL